MMSITLGLICVLLLVLASFYRKPSTLPGPRGLPYFGNVWLYMIGRSSKDIIPFLKYFVNYYGNIFELQIFGMNYVFGSEAELVKPILTSHTNITKGRFEWSFFKPMFRDGVIISEGEKWRTRRKILEPSFHFKILKRSIESVARYAEEYVSNLLNSEGKPTEIEDMIYLLTLKIICETAMGVKLNTEDRQQNEYVKASKLCHDGAVYRFFKLWLYPDFIYRRSNAGKTFFRSVDIIHDFATQVIRNRKELFIAEKTGSNNQGSTKKDKNAFLDNLLELDDSNPGLFTESDIEEEVSTFMIAGHNPSAATLKFLHFALANHPDVQEKLYDEQMEIFGNDKRIPTGQDLQKMIYLEMVIKETLRLYPIVPFQSRLLEEDLQIDENTIIPAGHHFVVVSFSIHRSKKHWDNPEEFIPERFAPGNVINPFSFIPFSAGPRSCIGQKYAMMEMKTIMSTVVRQCWLEPVTTSITLDYGIILKSAEPIIVKAFPRNENQRINYKRNN
ncbi:unnamed protein product [Nezara viridula]|uniref:Cytochrome P450 n=1 Tax=Nezara viridula TaxID=85310 RepID=A0A9P0HEC3_NEZVI|nr:unnamed protein product [Nezara viridula]